MLGANVMTHLRPHPNIHAPRRRRPVLATEPKPPRRRAGTEVYGDPRPMVRALAEVFERVREEFGVEGVDLPRGAVESEAR